MTAGEIEVLRNVIARLKKPDCGCSVGYIHNEQAKAMDLVRSELNAEIVGRLYLNTWVIPALELLLPEKRNVKTAIVLSR